MSNNKNIIIYNLYKHLKTKINFKIKIEIKLISFTYLLESPLFFC
jgi:hypothetical protein